MVTRKSILIINDEINLQVTLGLIFTHAGYKVITALNDQNALNILRARKFDLAILDINVFDRNGVVLLTDIKSNQPGLPVIVLTERRTQEAANYARQELACEIIEKPINPECILDVVTKILVGIPEPITPFVEEERTKSL